MFCLLVMYFPIPSKPTSTIASCNDGYYQLPHPSLLICLPVSRCATLFWKLLKAPSILRVSIHVFAPNKNTACVAAFKKCLDTFVSAPSRISIRNNYPQLFPALGRLPTTADQSSSPAVIIRPRYLNTVTFSK